MAREQNYRDKTQRDELALRAPITADLVANAIGEEVPHGYLANDTKRAVFMSIWAMMAYEWADAMMRESASVEDEA